jgi:glycerophosphoryl diester phosphodiesterase
MIQRWLSREVYTFSFYFLLFSFAFLSCKAVVNPAHLVKKPDIQGHRGCRGLYPENTLVGFLYAIDLGVNTLEMDVVISKDSQVIVSHEAYFNPEITTKPDGSYLANEDEGRKLNLYQMNYEDICKYDVGLKPHPRFIDQKKIAAIKPTLKEVIEKCELHAKQKGKAIAYNIEIKYEENGVGLFQPDYSTFVMLVLEAINKTKISDRTTVQSFEPEILNEVHQLQPVMKTILLVENTLSSLQNLSQLNHKPYAYSPAYRLVSEQLISDLHRQHIKLVPWTVNDEVAISTLLRMGVDGIISDYPDKVLSIFNKIMHEKDDN